MLIASISILLVYTGILLFLSLFFIKRTLLSFAEYAFCGRQLTFFFVLVSFLGTWIGGGSIIGLVGSTYIGGMTHYWIFAMSCVVSYFFAMLFLSRVRKLNVKNISVFLKKRFPGSKFDIGIPATLVILVKNVTIIGMQFAALSYLFVFAFQFDKNIAVLITFIIITIYTAFSGLWAVLATDIIQGSLQSIGMFMLLFLSVKQNGGINNMLTFFEDNKNMLSFFDLDTPVQSIVAIIITFGLFSLMGDGVDWERIYSSKSEKIAFWGYLIPLTITLLLLLIPAVVGVFIASYDGIDVGEQYVLFEFLFRNSGPVVTAFIITTLISAIMSSADSYMLNSGTIFAQNVIKQHINKDADDKEMIFWSRMGIIVAGAIGFAFAINIHNIVLLWGWGIIIATTTLLPEYIMAWFSKKVNTVGAVFGSYTGLVFSLIVLFSGESYSAMTILLGLGLNTVVAYAVSVFCKPPEEEIIKTTYYFQEKFN
jgi:SSS family solute:Na+ symporter